MKKDKFELVRIQTLIENDRLNKGDDFEELIINDIHKLLIDYFEYRELPSLCITKNGNKLNVVISLQAIAIKPFSVVPK